MTDFAFDPATLNSAASSLRSAAWTIDQTDPSPPVNAGALTEVVRAALAVLCGHAATASAALYSSADKVDASLRDYQTTDANVAATLPWRP